MHDTDADARHDGQFKHLNTPMTETAGLPVPETSDDALPPGSADWIARQLEEDIVIGRLHPRERLVEDDLMARFEVKRHVVREALATLDRMGLVERRRNVGALVRFFSSQQVQELYALRSLLEVEAARQISMPVAADKLAHLEGIQAEHDAAVQQGDARKVFRINLEFHRALFALSGNDTLLRAIDEFARQTYAIRFAGLISHEYRAKAREEHWQMIGALKRGDNEALQALCRSHLLPSRDAYLQTQSLIEPQGA